MSREIRYYKINDDKYIQGRWHLRMPLFNEGEEGGELFDTWRFNEGRVLEIERPIRLSMNPVGEALDYTESMGLPVVHQRVVLLFERLGFQKEVQFIPVEVEGHSEPWFILNAMQVIRCIDDVRCEEVLYWGPEDGEPDRVGEYQNVRGLKVEVKKIGDAPIFRPWGWLVALIVSSTSRMRWKMRASLAPSSSKSDAPLPVPHPAGLAPGDSVLSVSGGST